MTAPTGKQKSIVLLRQTGASNFFNIFQALPDHCMPKGALHKIFAKIPSKINTAKMDARATAAQRICVIEQTDHWSAPSSF